MKFLFLTLLAAPALCSSTAAHNSVRDPTADAFDREYGGQPSSRGPAPSEPGTLSQSTTKTYSYRSSTSAGPATERSETIETVDDKVVNHTETDSEYVFKNLGPPYGHRASGNRPGNWVVAYNLDTEAFENTKSLQVAIMTGEDPPKFTLNPLTEVDVKKHIESEHDKGMAKAQWSFYVKCTEAATTRLVGVDETGSKWYSQPFKAVCPANGLSSYGPDDPLKRGTCICDKVETFPPPKRPGSAPPAERQTKPLKLNSREFDELEGTKVPFIPFSVGDGVAKGVNLFTGESWPRKPNYIEMVTEVLLAIMLLMLLYYCCLCMCYVPDEYDTVLVNAHQYQMPPHPDTPNMITRQFGNAGMSPTTPIVPNCAVHPEQMMSAFHEGPVEHLNVEIPDAAVPVAPVNVDLGFEEPAEIFSRPSPSIEIEEEHDYNEETNGNVVAI